ncbi:hypothetical protein A5877_002383 [Enterococcus sp. 3C7_DIV0644]|nr:hypothetical protein A5877_002383 [Enterococcus sp. 3C7_DIV0644]
MEEALFAAIGMTGSLTPISGGDVNQTYRFTTAENRYFLKTHPHVSSMFFQAEINGLAELAPFVRVPKIERLGQTEEGAFLLMEWIDSGEGQQRRLGQSLARLHQQTQETFGFTKTITSAFCRKSIRKPPIGLIFTQSAVWMCKSN